jgi:sigma-B regulation protein RsbU (phosphoserine phosphatase)
MIESPAIDEIQAVPAPAVYGASLYRVAESYYYVDAAARVDKIAEAFKRNPSIHVVGVVSGGSTLSAGAPEGEFIGVLVRENFFGMLGRPFGWDVLSKDSIQSFILEARLFNYQENIFMVASELKGELEGREVLYYGITDEAGRFKGVFSSKALLLYLAVLSQKDMEMAGLLQERLVHPSTIIEGKHFNFRAFSRAAKGMGGDFYFQKKIAKKTYFIAVGDVSGKGASASIVTSLLWGMLTVYDFGRGLRAFLREVNAAIIRTFCLERHLTGIFMVWDFERGEVKIADMGHGLCFLVRDGFFKKLIMPVMNYPLGIEQEIEPKIFKLKVKPGDLFCAYTDGLVEQRDSAGKELGDEVITELAVFENQDPAGMHQSVTGMLDRYRGDTPQSDDATWVQVEVK